MKFLKQYITKIMAATVLVFGMSATSNATLITQEVLVDGLFFGVVEVNTDDGVDIGGGLVEISSFVNLVLYDPFNDFLGNNPFVPVNAFGPAEIFLFNAVVDQANLFGGIEFLELDIESSNFYAYNGVFDAFANDPALENFIDVFDTFGAPAVISLFGELSLGSVTVNTPWTASLLLIAMGGLLVGRRKA